MLLAGADRNVLIALSFALAWTISPIAWQRLQAARSEAAARRGALAAALLLGGFYAAIVAAGMLFLPLFPGGGTGVPLVTRFVRLESGPLPRRARLRHRAGRHPFDHGRRPQRRRLHPDQGPPRASGRSAGRVRRTAPARSGPGLDRRPGRRPPSSSPPVWATSSRPSGWPRPSWPRACSSRAWPPCS
ncbi:MAG: hypothetical protein MZV63_64810 [Marinilabiliales bacterium]|nr:hypothetical protein [Marinilabiliales bacterium]